MTETKTPSAEDVVALVERLKAVGSHSCTAEVYMGHCREAASALSLLSQRVGELERALTEIAKGEGEFNVDQKIHAWNTIENMKGLANAALTPDAGEKGKQS